MKRKTDTNITLTPGILIKLLSGLTIFGLENIGQTKLPDVKQGNYSILGTVSQVEDDTTHDSEILWDFRKQFEGESLTFED